jgi:hypothetical protein
MEDNMSTRAIYTFYDSERNSVGTFDEVHVYKHHDGYPYCKFDGGEAGGLVWINDAKAFAWDLPRFEADEFAASFVKAHKSVGGGVRLIGDQKPWEYASDCEYWYKVSCVDGDLRVTVMSTDWWEDEPRQLPVMEGPLDELLATQRARKEVA